MSSSLLKKWLYQDVKPVWAHQFLDALSGGDTRAKKLAVVGFLARIQVEESSGLVLLLDRIPGERRAVFEEIHKLFGGEEGFNKKIAGESWTMAVLEKKEELLRELDLARGKRQRVLWSGGTFGLGLVGILLLVLWLGDRPPEPPSLEDLKPLMTPDRHATKTQTPSVSHPAAPVAKMSPVVSPPAQPAAPVVVAKVSPEEASPSQPVVSVPALPPEAPPMAPASGDPAVLSPVPATSGTTEQPKPSEQKIPDGSGAAESLPKESEMHQAAPATSLGTEQEGKDLRLATDDELTQSMLAIVDKEMEALAATEVETPAQAEPSVVVQSSGEPVQDSAARDVKNTTPDHASGLEWVETPLRVFGVESLRIVASQGDGEEGLQVGAVDKEGRADKTFNPRKVAIIRDWQSPYTVVADDQGGEAEVGLSVTVPDKKHVRFSVAKMLGRTVIREGERFELTKEIMLELGLFIQIVPREAFLLPFDAGGVVTVPRSFWNRIVEADGKWVTVSRKLYQTESGLFYIRDLASKKIQDIQSELDTRRGR